MNELAVYQIQIPDKTPKLLILDKTSTFLFLPLNMTFSRIRCDIFQAMTHFTEMCFLRHAFASHPCILFFDGFCQWPICIVLLFI